MLNVGELMMFDFWVISLILYCMLDVDESLWHARLGHFNVGPSKDIRDVRLISHMI